MLRLAFVLTMVWAQGAFAAATEKALTLVHYGYWSELVNGEPVSTKEYRMSYGDPSAQEAAAMSSGRSAMGPFAMNAAFYFQNPDGTWNLFNFRLPSESLTDPKALDERQRFRDYLSRADVRELLNDPYTKVDFGQPGDFIYKRMGLSGSELPDPFKRFPVAAMGKIEAIFQFNADLTAKLYFRKPYDLEGKAQPVFQELVNSLN